MDFVLKVSDLPATDTNADLVTEILDNAATELRAALRRANVWAAIQIDGDGILDDY